ncbi:cysteine-rich KTR domain-containing protein [Enterococcus faecium]|uniref:cysteine-rich KTR domain-containing protein n=1 Tax=Enterococcus faecium TaxID=1352 RepID=UPI003D7F3BCB
MGRERVKLQEVEPKRKVNRDDLQSLLRCWVGVIVKESKWILCPVCGNKTRDKIREDTVLINYPLYCPKCKQECLIGAKQLQIKVITEPDAQTQSR